MKLKSTVEQRAKKLGSKLNIDEILASYQELQNSKNILTLSNFSIDFMVQNNVAHSYFKEMIQRVEKEILRGKELKLENGYLCFKKHKNILYPVISEKTIQHKLAVVFSSKNSLNDWMHREINKKLSENVHIQITKGVILTNQSGNTKVVFNEEFLEANG